MSVAQVYNEIAEEFSDTRAYLWPWVTEFINDIKQHTKKEDTKVNILDIGCGSGRNIKAYSDDIIQVKGIDLSSKFVEMCKSNNMDVVLGNMTNMPFEKESFNYIIAIASFHHLESESDRIMALKEMWRILKPNGTILISVWSKTQPKKTKRQFQKYGDQMVPWKSIKGIEYKRYYYIFKLEEIIHLFEKVGFSIERMSWNCGNEIFIIKKISETAFTPFLI